LIIHTQPGGEWQVWNASDRQDCPIGGDAAWNPDELAVNKQG